MTRRERKDQRMSIQVSARAMRLRYGASECRREDADEHLAVLQSVNATKTETVVPVQWILTRNRGILETLA